LPDEVIDCGLFPASRGFERVEQIDVEECGIFATAKPYVTDQQELFQPPVKTVAWFHTGVCSSTNGLSCRAMRVNAR
jgi:hypothetical protein